jgi:alpha-1,3-glucosyltransferase
MAGENAGPSMVDKVLLDIPMIVLLTTTLRWLVSLSGYSGFATSPRFGDYEAQRHWMEITINNPIGDWYRQTIDNDLQYWGLDYPPLTAYISWLCGGLSSVIEPPSVVLGASRGYETDTHKVFMRGSVLVLDVLVFFPAAWWLCKRFAIGGDRLRPMRYLLVLLQPALILIDHGHFQYNSTSLGLTIAAAAALLDNRELVGSFLFCLSLNFKQMSLYHAPGTLAHSLHV